MDIVDPKKFLYYFSPYAVSSWLYLYIVHSGSNGVFKSFAAAGMMNQAFTYYSVKHMFYNFIHGKQVDV